MAKVDNEKNFYVPLSSPTDLKKDLLGNVKKVLIMLKRYEKFKHLRQEKLNYLHQLRQTIKELETLNNKLTRALPKTSLRAMPPSKIKNTKKTEKNNPEPKKEEKPIKKEDVSVLHKIEKEIEHIENRLNDLE